MAMAAQFASASYGPPARGRLIKKRRSDIRSSGKGGGRALSSPAILRSGYSIVLRWHGQGRKHGMCTSRGSSSTIACVVCGTVVSVVRRELAPDLRPKRRRSHRQSGVDEGMLQSGLVPRRGEGCQARALRHRVGIGVHRRARGRHGVTPGERRLPRHADLAVIAEIAGVSVVRRGLAPDSCPKRRRSHRRVGVQPRATPARARARARARRYHPSSARA